MTKPKKRRPRKCPSCGGKLREVDFCYDCNRPLDESEYECQECYSRFDEFREEI